MHVAVPISTELVLFVFLCLLLVLVSWYLLAFLKNLINHFASETLHQLVFELLHSVTAHYFCANLLLLVAHHVARLEWMTLLGELLVTVEFFLHSLLK